YLVLAVAGRSFAGLILGIIIIDAGVQTGHVANQSRIYNLAADARSRLNTFYMVAFFAGGALGSYCGTLGWKLWGWAGFCGLPLAAVGFAFAYVLHAQSGRSFVGVRAAGAGEGA